jgi:7-cyano-7-deazaguanine synthase
MSNLPSREAAVLVSGGIDSAVLASEMTRRFALVHPIYVRFGLRWEDAELSSLRDFLGRLGTSRLGPLVVLDEPVEDVYGDHWSLGGSSVPGEDSPDEAVYLPGRNVLLVSKAAVWCRRRGIETLALGCLASNPFTDSTPEFFRALEAALRQGLGSRIELIRPFERLAKSEVMRIGSALPIGSTFSCLNPVDGHHCGSCNKCGERRRAFRSVDQADPTRYAARSASAHRGIPCIE